MEKIHFARLALRDIAEIDTGVKVAPWESIKLRRNVNSR